MKYVLVFYQSDCLANMSSRCANRKNIKKYVDIYLITKIYLCEPNDVLSFPIVVYILRERRPNSFFLSLNLLCNLNT